MWSSRLWCRVNTPIATAMLRDGHSNGPARVAGGIRLLVYQATKSDFMSDVERGVLVDSISRVFERRIHRPNPGEVRSWQNSMQHIYVVLNTPEIPRECGVAIEFTVPYTGSRIDFLLTGSAAPELPNPTYDAAVIIELKQWQELKVTERDGIVTTLFNGRPTDTSHPSYQAWSYAQMIENYNEAVREEQIVLLPCAYLHNYHPLPQGDPLLDERYSTYLAEAPVFCAEDVFRLRAFICRHIARGDDRAVLHRIESGRLRPSKSLQDALSGMLEGNDEFVMIDDQKVIFEQALELASRARSTGEKQVMIVRGGPGTGKSVVAVNLLVRLTADDMVVQYVSKNSAPRNVYRQLLKGARHTKAYIDGLFRGPDQFHTLPKESFDALVVDEAHRLREQSGLYGNLGENQMAELIGASRLSVFFIDENQRVTTADAGSEAEIRLFAKRAGAAVTDADLTSQFRCNGSDSYLEWLDDRLGIRPAKEPSFPDFDYDFRVFDDPNAMLAAILEKNARANKARIVAGYCWEWPTDTRRNPNARHVVVEEHGFGKPWNLASTDTWAIDDDSVQQVGCIHTCQGLEFDYVGVIVGDDLRFEDGRVVTDPSRRAKSDASLKGLKQMSLTDPERARSIADEIIRNTYRVLMTRGMKGCFVYCTDPALAEYLRSSVPASTPRDTYPLSSSAAVPIAAEGPPEE
jgi:DUF2075 family protein